MPAEFGLQYTTYRDMVHLHELGVINYRPQQEHKRPRTTPVPNILTSRATTLMTCFRSGAMCFPRTVLDRKHLNRHFKQFIACHLSCIRKFIKKHVQTTESAQYPSYIRLTLAHFG
jgi:hypothetical protein